MTLESGKIVAEHYQLLRQLGQGSFGDVWLAHNLLADIDVAIKFYGTLDKKGLEEFRNEFKIAYRLQHPNLLNINHFDVFENCPYLVMPYCENGSVSSHIGQLSEGEIWKFVSDVSGGLAFLHNQQPPIVHQDIKPDNILITSDGRYVISDFGISHSFRTKMSQTRNTDVSSSGTLAYMGPERFSERPMVVLASDIWAFGMTLYEVMTGNVLWEGMGGCVQLNGARLPVFDSSYSSALTELVRRCLAAETWNRPTAQQVFEYAEGHLKHRTAPPLIATTPSTDVTGSTDTYAKNNQTSKKPTPVYLSQATYDTQAQSVNPSFSQSAYRPHSHGSYNEGSHNHHSSTSPQPYVDDDDSLFPPFVRRIALIAVASLLLIFIVYAGVNTLFGDDKEQELQQKTPIESSVPNSEGETVTSSKQQAATHAVVTSRKGGKTKNSDKSVTSKKQRQQSVIVYRDAPAPAAVSPSRSTQASIAAPTATSTSSAAPTTSPPSQARPSSDRMAKFDDAYFSGCKTKADYQAYLKKYPNGRHRQAALKALGIR